MENHWKSIAALCLMTAASAIGIAGAEAQSSARRPNPTKRVQYQPVTSSQAVTFHNNYTSENISATLTLPAQQEAVPAALLLTGDSEKERQAANALGAFLAKRGIATMRLPASALSGSAEDANLNALAALNYLRSRRDIRGSQVGVIGYGDGVTLAPVTASQANAASFLVLLGGSVLPDKLNRVPDKFNRNVVPKEGVIQNLKNVHCPVLVLLGEFDAFGTQRATAENVTAIREALNAGDNTNYTIKMLDGEDRWLAETSDNPTDEAANAAVPSASALKTTADWLGKQTRTATANAQDNNDEVNRPRKVIQLYPKSAYGQLPYHAWYEWVPPIGGQPRNFGYWYW